MNKKFKILFFIILALVIMFYLSFLYNEYNNYYSYLQSSYLNETNNPINWVEPNYDNSYKINIFESNDQKSHLNSNNDQILYYNNDLLLYTLNGYYNGIYFKHKYLNYSSLFNLILPNYTIDENKLLQYNDLFSKYNFNYSHYNKLVSNKKYYSSNNNLDSNLQLLENEYNLDFSFLNEFYLTPTQNNSFSNSELDYFKSQNFLNEIEKLPSIINSITPPKINYSSLTSQQKQELINNYTLLRISPFLRPSDNIPDSYIFLRIEKNRLNKNTLSAYIYLDNDWKNKFSNTNILWSSSLDKPETIKFRSFTWDKQINGIYYNKISNVDWFKTLPSLAAIMVGDINIEDIPLFLNNKFNKTMVVLR